MPSWRSVFRELAERRTRESMEARLAPLVTTSRGPLESTLHGVGTDWTRRYYDGNFHLVPAPDGTPAISLVFVQSREGNTGADDPAILGGGPTDRHLIYEGLSRVAADGVLAGASTAAGSNAFFSLWHPELLTLRRQLGRPRHPAQIVLSARGRIDLEGVLLFNVPEVRVFVLAGEQCRERCGAALPMRPWITMVPMAQGGLRAALATLRRDHGIERISAIGGRTTASALVDAHLVQDLCLTTTSRSAGDPTTPRYTGLHTPSTDVIVRKEGTDPRFPIVFEHLALCASRLSLA
jgi:riboflavin biosynthesis pyrimidine reductase